jgi:hypothetical protein
VSGKRCVLRWGVQPRLDVGGCGINPLLYVKQRIRPLGTVLRVRGFLVETADCGIAGERREKLLQAGARGDSAGAEDDIVAIGRDAVRKVGGGHVGDEAREDFNKCV